MSIKKKNTAKDKDVANESRRKNRLASIKNELEAGRITNFEQIFAIMSETRLAIEMGISFYAFRRKVFDPGDFTLNEVIRFAQLFGVKYETMEVWLRNRLKEKTKIKIFKE
jgi:hypothetical protein